MIEYFNLALNERKIKSVLSIIFIASIASEIFERNFFQYSIIDITDLNALYFFFIKGHFIVPFVLFYLVRAMTTALGVMIFKLPNVLITRKFGRAISDAVLWWFSRSGNKQSAEVVLPESHTFQWMIRSTETEKLDDKAIRRRVVETHRELESDFTLILRAIIAISFYFHSLEYFGWGIYLICLCAFVLIYLLQVGRYHFIENLPSLINRHLDDKPNAAE